MIFINANVSLLIINATAISKILLLKTGAVINQFFLECRMVTEAKHTIDQNSEQKFRAVAIRRLVWKLDRRLIPFLFVLEMSSYLNRNSIGIRDVRSNGFDPRGHVATGGRGRNFPRLLGVDGVRVLFPSRAIRGG